jgi:hypothetical protein
MIAYLGLVPYIYNITLQATRLMISLLQCVEAVSLSIRHSNDIFRSCVTCKQAQCLRKHEAGKQAGMTTQASCGQAWAHSAQLHYAQLPSFLQAEHDM